MAEASHTYDSLINGEEFISDHFFTSGATSASFHAAVLKLRKQWDSEDGRSLRDTFLEDRASWETQLGALFADPDDAPSTAHAEAAAATTRRHLGFAPESVTWTSSRSDAELVVPGVVRQDSILLLEAAPARTVEDLFAPTSRALGEAFQDDKPFERSLPKLISEIFAADDHPEWVMVLAGPWVLLTQRDRWAEGRYLAVNLLLALQRAHLRKGGELDRVLAILGRDSLLPEADGTLWWDGVLEDSAEHAVGVSKDLREGIRASIEIIANDVLCRRADRGLTLEDIDAQDLSRQSLRFLYRILFLLFAETRPDMGLVPVGADEYEEGYGLARLRELTLVEMTTERTRRGTHLYDSLSVLFRLVRKGNQPELVADVNPSLRFDALESDLFSRDATAAIDEVGLSNHAAQRVLQHLLLTPQSSGDRGFISYAELGVNQLGAVYEGLMSYTGFFAAEALYEVAPGGDTSKGSWTVPASRADRLDLSPDDFVLETDPITGERHTRIHRQGSFVFRLAGRERQQSASYYTPEVLTRFVVSQALEELLDQNDQRTPADDILQLSICEPALGSGAFAIEAVRQLATEYLTRKQEELNEQIPAEQMPAELAKVKAHIALHQVYGVDLNATAVELAEVSLWLDTMVPGLNAPWFGLRLRRGNSLIGAQRATFRRDQVLDRAKPYLRERPEPRSLDADRPGLSGEIFHFLLPHEGWGAATGAKKSARDLVPDAVKDLKTWQRQMRKALTSSKNPNTASWAKLRQVERLQDLSARVEVLWDFVTERLQLAESEAQRDLDFFGNPLEPTGNGVARKEIEGKLADPESAYQRLRRVMDAWCALWFWPLTEDDVTPPSIDEWIDALTRLLGRSHQSQDYLVPSGSPWEQLNERENLDLRLNGAEPIDAILDAHPWLRVTARIAKEQGFFHWELDFATVFQRGGFDLQVGNPPWVRPDIDEKAMFAEFDPWWKLASSTPAEQANARISVILSMPGAQSYVLEQHATLSSTRKFLSSAVAYEVLAGLRTDLYRCFMVGCWSHASTGGIAGLLHPETHLIDVKGGSMREATYRRLRRFWQFDNNTSLFVDVDDHVKFAVNVYGRSRKPGFLMASSLRAPGTVIGSLRHDGSGDIPSIKDGQGKWDTRPHNMRISRVTMDTLRSWGKLLEPPGTPVQQSRIVYAINEPSARVLQLLATDRRVGDLDFLFSSGWNETTDHQNGTFVTRSKVNAKLENVILQGRHIGVSNPLFKQPNEPLKSKSDWVLIDHEGVNEDFIPRTLYQPGIGPELSPALYRSRYSSWDLIEGGDVRTLSALDCYRMVWRSMANLTSVRTLHATLMPPGVAHPNGIFSLAPRDEAGHTDLVLMVGFASSLISDFFIRSTAGSAVSPSLVRTLPMPTLKGSVEKEIIWRVLRLNCATRDYAEIFEDVSGEAWRSEVFIREPARRRLALIELDVLVALSLGVAIDDLCALYRTQFSVLRHKYEERDRYDTNGRLVPADIVKLADKQGDETGAGLGEDDRTWVHLQSEVTYVAAPPFRQLDREADMRAAYERFRPLLEDEGVA